MKRLSLLKEEIASVPLKGKPVTQYLMYLGYSEHFDNEVPIARAFAIESLFTRHEPFIYKNDLIAGSLRGRMSDDPELTDATLARAAGLVSSYGSNHFWTNADHFAPDYKTFLEDGVGGTLEKIDKSKEVHRHDPDAKKKLTFLRAAEIAMRAFGRMILRYGEAAEATAAQSTEQIDKDNFLEIARICRKLSVDKPETFREALQLVWLTHIAFVYEGRYAMALGRLDQYLYPFYLRDIQSGRLARGEALELVECTLYKIGEMRLFGGDDVVNIAIAGRGRDGRGALNELSYIILEAVKNCNIPGPNLSVRLYDGIPDDFIDKCLQSIGTGLGYPALMNDEVNIPALHRHGYSIEDSRDYCMVGCIENFIQGKQPPWSDGRYNSPKYIELALNNGRCMLTGALMGPKTGDSSEFDSMDAFIAALVKQMEFGAAEYMARFRNENDRYNRINYIQPFQSCFCRCCIERGLDINDGGALYPSVHGAGCMGIGTFADSLSAIEEVVYNKKAVTLSGLRDALAANFEGYEELRQILKGAPKYGNDNDFADKYAVWFVEVHDKIFSKYRTPDGGAIYTAIASNISNIPAGAEIAATPDGRGRGEPISDAASPMHGMDTSGPTAVILSVSKPDYTKVSCGTVVNQKYSPAMFENDELRAKLLSLIKVYMSRGGQEIQINSVSRDILIDAMNNPDKYKSLVVRVSGFSAYYTTLDRRVQEDILKRTEHG
jgi:pyruvate formate-lyase/glycerol dehydratase family glycyl radical enzyme